MEMNLCLILGDKPTAGAWVERENFLENPMEDEDKAIDVGKKLAAGANSAKPKKISMKNLKRKQVEEEEVEVEQPESDASFGTDVKL